MSQPQAELSTELLTWAARDTTPRGRNSLCSPNYTERGAESQPGPGFRMLPGSSCPVRASAPPICKMGLLVLIGGLYSVLHGSPGGGVGMPSRRDSSSH